MSSFDHDSYRTGVFVGRIIGALIHGCKDMAGTWPKDASPDDRKEIEAIADMRGLVVKFDDAGFSVTERKPPKLEVVK